MKAHSGIGGLLLVGITVWLVLGVAGADTFSHVLSFQGRLCDRDTGKPWPDGKYEVTFTIYNAETDGEDKWRETQIVDQVGGVFSVYLGSVTAFPEDLFTNGDRWLSLQVADDEEMKHRYRVAPSAQAIYAGDSAHAAESDHAAQADHAMEADAALYAQDSDKLDGLHASGLVQLAPAGPQTGAAVNLVGTGTAPAVALENEGLVLAASTTAREWACSWIQMDPPTSPPPRWDHRLAYDTESDRVILFGGNDRTFLHDTWAYDCNTDTWTERTPPNSPPGRFGHAMAHDAESDRVILFGGTDAGSTPLGDTWAYDLNSNTWTQMPRPPVSPHGRWDHEMAYDAESDLVILFGGYDGISVWDDTWAYDYNTNTWTRPPTPPVHPSARFWHGMAYDAESDRVILFGGLGSEGEMRDTWAYHYNTNTWTEMHPPISPPPRWEHEMAYDSQSDRVVLFGGAIAGSILGDTWTYDFNTDTWTEETPPNSPRARYGCGMAYDADSDRAVIFAGPIFEEPLGDTWVFSLYNSAPAAEFDGSVLVRGDLLVTGEKNAVVATESFGERKVYCQESTEVWFEHIGSARLEKGVATVRLDPVFLETVTVDRTHPMQVFISPYTPMREFWVERSDDSFTVRTEDKTITGEFGYRVVAKRKGFENEMLEPTRPKTYREDR